MTEKDFWIAMNLVPGLGKTLFYRLLNFFGSAEGVFKVREKELRQVEGIGERLAAEISQFHYSERVEREKKFMESNEARALIASEDAYPENLKNIYDPPPVLYMQGEAFERGSVAIAVVGTRLPTHYGRLVAEKISMELAKRGVTVVSGMARGVDTCAHKGALDGGGRTIAVLGSGLSVVYPPENVRLRNKMIHQGAIVSEFSMTRKPDRGNFPARNRVISGLSTGVVVVEAGEKSGALITVQFALDQGRDVFAVPGNINSPKSRGTNLLIKKGAKLVEKSEDILEELPLYVKSLLQEKPVQVPKDVPLSEEEKKVLSAIAPECTHIDSIIENTNLSASRVSALLLTLELKGVVKQLPGKLFVVP